MFLSPQGPPAAEEQSAQSALGILYHNQLCCSAFLPPQAHRLLKNSIISVEAPDAELEEEDEGLEMEAIHAAEAAAAAAAGEEEEGQQQQVGGGGGGGRGDEIEGLGGVWRGLKEQQCAGGC